MLRDHGGDDHGPAEVLAHLGVPESALVGSGGEAWVYAIDDERVVRILRPTGEPNQDPRYALVNELRRTPRAFQLPEMLDHGSVGSRYYWIERRIEGRSVALELQSLDRQDRNRLITAHLDAAASLGDLRLDERGFFGDLVAPNPVRTQTWHGYLVEKVATSVAAAPGFDAVDAEELAAGMPECESGTFVHLDAYAANMLAAGSSITAVIDIGTTSVVGDRRLDALSATVYLCASPITPEADDADRAVARAWLDDAGLASWFEPARRWLAGYWAHAVDDQALHQWCRDVLL